MDRRKSLKLIGLGAFSTGALLNACETAPKKEKEAAPAPEASTIDRTPEEKAHDNIVINGRIFTDHERETIAVLSDIIIPADGTSGSATEAEVPKFIEAIAIDMPQHQTPLRGGLRWLDLQMVKRHGAPFKDCSQAQQLAMVDGIAYPAKAAPEMTQGVTFFNLMRNLVISGFYTSPLGIKDLGYAGNVPNQWDGVPDDVLKQYGLAYTEKELKECISFSPAT